MDWYILTGFGTACVPKMEPARFFERSTARLISKMDLREIGCEDGRWMELAQDRVQWQALVLAVLNLLVQLPES